MRDRERGIGNLPFIAVLVLFVVAIALFFMKQDEADTEKARRVEAGKKLNTSLARQGRLEQAYNALREVVGVNDAGLLSTGDDASSVPSADKIKGILHGYLNNVTTAVAKASEARLITRNYKVTGATVTSTTGDTSIVQGYIPTATGSAANFKNTLDPLADAMKSMVKIAQENNQLFENEKKRYDVALKASRGELAAEKVKYAADVATKQRAAEGTQADLKKARDRNTQLTQTIDNNASTQSQEKEAWAREKRDLTRRLSAAINRYTNEKIIKDLALKEDPRDGNVLRVSETLGTVWISLGTKHKLSRGTKFTVWRPGKGNIRHNVAVVQVINVYKSRAETRIIRRLSSVHPTKGMNVSNPFYDPKGKLKVYIYGDLKNYPTDIAARRLAANGATVSRSLDDTVNVIVLGEPPRSGDEDAIEDEGDAAAAATKASMDRSRRLDAIMRKAITIGAIVVSEDVLATFIDY